MNLTMPRTVSALVLAVLASCSSERAPQPRGIPGGEDRPAAANRQVAADEPAQPERAEVEPPRRALPSPFEPGPGDLMAPAQPEQAAAPQPEEEQPKRDLGNELAEAARRSGCLDMSAAAKQPGGKLRITATAYVMPSGRITRATVSAPGQPAAALRCAEARLTATGLPGPFEKAESIRGETTIEVVAAVAPAPATAAAPAPSPAAVYPNAPPAPYVEGAEPPPTQADMARPTSDYSVTGTARPDEQAGAPE
jgi:hypothetical protein